MTWNLLQYFMDEMISATLYQYGAGSTDANGDWVPGSESSEPIDVIAPQPVKPDEIEMMEPGERISDYVKIWVEDTVTLTTRNDTADADELVIDGNRYRVHAIPHWEFAGGYVAAILRRLQ